MTVVNSDIYKIDNFISWVDKQPADNEYDWFCGDTCPVALYAKAHNLSIGDIHTTMYELYGICLSSVLAKDMTYGGLSVRLNMLRLHGREATRQMLISGDF